MCAFLCVPACVWGILAACVTASRVERRQNGVARWNLIWTLWLGKALWSWSDYVTLITEASGSSSCPAIRERWYKGRDNTCLLNHIYDVSLSWCAKKNPTTTKKKDNHGCNTYVTCHFPNFQRLCWRSKIWFYSPTRPEHPQQSESASKRQLESCKLNFGNGIYIRKIHWESVGSGNWKPDNWWANIVEAGGDDMQAGNDYAVIPGQSGTLRGGTLKK